MGPDSPVDRLTFSSWPHVGAHFRTNVRAILVSGSTIDPTSIPYTRNSAWNLLSFFLFSSLKNVAHADEIQGASSAVNVPESHCRF